MFIGIPCVTEIISLRWWNEGLFGAAGRSILANAEDISQADADKVKGLIEAQVKEWAAEGRLTLSKDDLLQVAWMDRSTSVEVNGKAVSKPRTLFTASVRRSKKPE